MIFQQEFLEYLFIFLCHDLILQTKNENWTEI